MDFSKGPGQLVFFGLRRAWANVKSAFAMRPEKELRRHSSRLKPVQQLEDRCLLSASPIETQFRVNTYTQGAQQTFPQTPQAVAMNPTTGDYVVVWSSQGQNGGGGWDIYMQRYNAAGVAQGGETLVDTPVNGVNQQYANVAMNASGAYIVTWSSQQGGNWTIYAQQYNASGVAQGAAIVVSGGPPAPPAPPTNVEYPTVAINNSGEFVVTWSEQSAHWQIYADVFNQNGVSQTGAIQVTNATVDQMYSDVALAANGSFVITWSSHQAHWDIYAQIYGSNNQPVGTTFQVNTNTTDDQEYSAIAMDAGGDFTITWSGHQNGHWNIYAQSYFADGSANGANFQVNASTNQDQEYSSITFAGSADPIITWSSNDTGPAAWDVYAQQVTPTGTLVGGAFEVNTYTLDNQFYSSIAGAANGAFTVVWTSNNEDGSNFGVYGQQFNVPVSPAAGVSVSGNSFLVSVDNNVLRVDTVTGTILATYPTGVPNDGAVFGPDGSLYVADYYNNRILHYDPTGALLGSFGAGQLNDPQGLTFGPNGNLYVANADSSVQEFTPAGGFVGTFITAGSGGLNNAKALVFGPDGNAYVSSYFNSEVLRYNGTTGAFLGVFATGSGGFEDLTFGPDNNLYVASYGDDTVYRYSGVDGSSLGSFVSGGSLVNPFGLRFDEDGNLDVTSRSSGQILVYNGATGVFERNLTTGLTNPAYLTTTPSLVTSETGTTATFSVALTSEPVAPVTVSLATSVAGEGALSQTTLSFDASNWNVAQTVTVTGLDDHIVHGDQTYQITGTTASADPNYNGLAMAPVTVVNKEADVASITVTPTALETSKSGASATFGMALTSEPLDPVTVNLSSTDPSEGSLSQSALVFDNTDWNVAQNVTVTGLNDFAAGDTSYQINGAAISADSHYNGLAMTPVAVTNKGTSTPGFIVNPSSIQTSQTGTSASFSIALTSLPVLPVTVNLVNNDPTEGSLSQNSLTFSLLNWGTPQNVTVTGLDDHIVHGDQTYQVTGSATSLDPLYNGLAITPVTVVNKEADVAGFTVTPSTLTTSETGTFASFAVALTSEPVAPVTVTLVNGNPTEGTLSQSTLTYNAADWNMAQNVTVTGLDDHIVHGDQTYQITGTASSPDGNYNGLSMTPVTIINKEADVAGFTVMPTTITTSQDGTSASFTVALTSEPLAPIQLNLSATEAGQGDLSQSSLTFNAANWNVTQTVTVTGLDDFLTTGDQTYQIAGIAASTDSHYNGLGMTPVTVVNKAISAATLITSETGTTATFAPYLTSQPSAPVTLNLSMSIAGEGMLSQTVLVFTTTDWHTPHTVTVTGLDDHIVHGDQTYEITGITTSSDHGYNGLSMAPITVINKEADVASITVTKSSLTTMDTGGAASFGVTLTSEPLAPVTVSLTSSITGQGALSQNSLTFTAATWNVPQPVTVTGQNLNGISGTVSYEIRGTGASTDGHYNGLAMTPITVTNLYNAPSSAPPTTSASTSAPSSSLIETLLTLSQLPSGATLPVSSSEGNTSSSSAQTAQLAIVALAANARNSASSVIQGAATVSAQNLGGGLGPSRSVVPAVYVSQVLARTHPDAAREDVYVPPPPPGTDALVASAAAAPASSHAGVELTPLTTDFLHAALDEAADSGNIQETTDAMGALVSTGVIASAGYMLLNTRTGFWLLSAVASRPLWKQFDPLEILYSWEKASIEDETKEETLLSLVD